MAAGQYASASGEEFIWEIQVEPGSSWRGWGGIDSEQMESDTEETAAVSPLGTYLMEHPALSQC